MPIVPAREAIVGATASHIELTTFTPISLAGLAPLYLEKERLSESSKVVKCLADVHLKQ